MCGIIGYTGSKNCIPILLDGLARLEYRGYDSAGIAAVSNGSFILKKRQGKIKELTSIVGKNLNAHCGIGHTRWATHGAPSDMNAHPHISCNRKIAVAHNGIIENFIDLQNDLKKNHRFNSQTDSEVIAHLIEEHFNGNPLRSIVKAIRKVRGSFALGIAFLEVPDTIIAVRLGSPLVLGFSPIGTFMASDIPAILPYTKRVYILDDRQIAVIKPNGVQIYDFNEVPIQIKETVVNLSAESAQKEGFKHFMLKEIFEQPRTLGQVLQGRASDKSSTFTLENLNKNRLKSVKKIIISGCGTAYHAAIYGKYVIEELAGIPVDLWIASELRYADYPFERDSHLVAISQSGETADTLESVRLAKQNGIKTLAITNIHSSTVARESDMVIYMRAGLEIGVAATKTYTAQLLSLLMLAVNLARAKGNISSEKAKKIIHEVRLLPGKLDKILKNTTQIEKCSKRFLNGFDFMFIGRRHNTATAYEGALKMKEISYLHAEGYAAGEMKHGPLALVDKNLATVAIVPHGRIYEKMISNIQEIRSRHGKVISIASEGDDKILQISDFVLTIPAVSEYLSPILAIVPLQLFAYYTAHALGRDVDQPRNLAKSVTVE